MRPLIRHRPDGMCPCAKEKTFSGFRLQIWFLAQNLNLYIKTDIYQCQIKIYKPSRIPAARILLRDLCCRTRCSRLQGDILRTQPLGSRVVLPKGDMPKNLVFSYVGYGTGKSFNISFNP